MYTVTAKTKAKGPDIPGRDVDWVVGQVREVHEDCIKFYLNNPSAWDVRDDATVRGIANSTGRITFSVGGQSVDDAVGGVKTVVFGDSMLQAHQNFWYGTAQVLAMSRSGGVVTVQINSHSMPTGRKIRVINATPTDFNGEFAITRIDANNFSYASAGSDGAADRTGVSVIDREWVSSKSVFAWGNGLLGGSLKLTKNLGVGGNTTAQMLARVSDVLAQSPDVAIVLGGYNDVGTLTSAQTISNLQSIYAQLTNAGILVVACTMIPLSASGAKWSAANVEHVLAVNRAIRQAAFTYRRLRVADCFRKMVDKHNTTNRGAAVTNTIDTDFVHPSARGAFLIGRAIYDALYGVVPMANWAGVSCAAETAVAGQNNYNAIDNAPNATSGGTVSAPATGTAATGVTVERVSGSTGACVASVVTDTDGTYLQRASITPGGAEVWNTRSNSGGTILTRLTAGERRRLSLRLKLSGLTSGHTLTSCVCWFSMTVDGVNYYAYIGSATTTMPVDGDCSLTLISEPFIIPAGTMSNCSWMVQSTFSGTFATAINIDVGDVTLLQTTDEPA